VGTTIKIYLPRLEEPTEPARLDTARTETFVGSETILVVEDEPAVRRVIEQGLRDLGDTVIAASGGETALRSSEVHESPIQLLITDVVMPGMSKRMLAETLTASRPETKVL